MAFVEGRMQGADILQTDKGDDWSRSV